MADLVERPPQVQQDAHRCRADGQDGVAHDLRGDERRDLIEIQDLQWSEAVSERLLDLLAFGRAQVTAACLLRLYERPSADDEGVLARRLLDDRLVVAERGEGVAQLVLVDGIVELDGHDRAAGEVNARVEPARQNQRDDAGYQQYRRQQIEDASIAHEVKHRSQKSEIRSQKSDVVRA